MTAVKQRLAYLIALHPDWTHQRIADELHKSVSFVDKWSKDEEIRDLVDKSLHILFRDAANIAVNTMINLAANGDRQAALYILDNNGFKVSEKIELSGNDIKIHISND